MIIKVLSERLSQVTSSFIKPNSFSFRGSKEKSVDRERFELFQEKRFIQPKNTARASNNNDKVNSLNYLILLPNRYKNLEAHGINSNTTTDITDTDYNRETTN